MPKHALSEGRELTEIEEAEAIRRWENREINICPDCSEKIDDTVVYHPEGQAHL